MIITTAVIVNNLSTNRKVTSITTITITIKNTITITVIIIYYDYCCVYFCEYY